MKRFTLAIVGCAMALGAMAHRDVYFSVDMTSGSGWDHAAWTVDGATLEKDDAGLRYLVATGDLIKNGKTTVQIKHDSRNHGERYMPTLSKVFLTVSATDYSGVAHVTPRAVVRDEYGEEVTFSFNMLPDTYETALVESTSISGDPSQLGRINEFYIYFDGVNEGEEIDLATVGLGTDWVMPSVSPSRQVECYSYSRGPEDTSKPGVRTLETGVTYIQAEDFDEPWINNRTTHASNGGSNNNRLYREDQNVNIAYEGSAGFGDGSPYGRWYKDHGHVVGNRWAGNDDLLGEGAYSGGLLHNWCPGGESDLYYKYSGEYVTPGANDDPIITLENGLKKWGIWAEYTFDVEEDCTIDISLAVAAHRTAYEGGMNSILYWWSDKKDGGYVIEGFEDNTYMSLMGFRYTVALDGVMQRTAYDAAPLLQGNGIEFLNDIKDPRKWVNNQDDVNGEKLNSHYLGVWPWPYWADDQDDTNLWGCGWYAYYKDNLLKTGVEKGVIPQSVCDRYAHGDFVNIPVKKGRHTIKVQNCGGLSFFDEIRIQAHSSGAGVDGVTADGLEGAYEGTPTYFDLQGRQVANPSNGIYLVKRGKTITKEVIR